MARYLEPHFCPELLEQYLIYLGYDQLLACCLVCWAWNHASKRLLFQVLNLNHTRQYEAFCNNTDPRRLPRQVIAPSDYCDRQQFHILPGLHAVRHFEISFRTFAFPMLLSTAIQTLSGSLRSVVIHDTMGFSYQRFIDVLEALHLCKGLRQLSLPPPIAIGDTKGVLSTVARELAGRTLATGVLPVLTFLQLVSRNDRHNPKLQFDTEWVCTSGFPFCVEEVETLVVGSPTAACYLLPRVASNLVSLEYCARASFDWHACWAHFSECHRIFSKTTLISIMIIEPVTLPHLKNLRLAFPQTPPQHFLDMIRAPAIEEIKLEGRTTLLYDPFGWTLQPIDRSIGRLDFDAFPQYLRQLSLSLGPNPGLGSEVLSSQCLGKIFPRCVAHNVSIIVLGR